MNFIADIQIRDRRYSTARLAGWHTIARIDWKTIPFNTRVQLTSRAIEHWQNTKSNLGYATFRDLEIEDILSICHATRRQEVELNINRMGKTAYYKIRVDK